MHPLRCSKSQKPAGDSQQDITPCSVGDLKVPVPQSPAQESARLILLRAAATHANHRPFAANCHPEIGVGNLGAASAHGLHREYDAEHALTFVSGGMFCVMVPFVAAGQWG